MLETVGDNITWPQPTPEEQVGFLRNIQRLLSEGQFTATYKFALLHALADLAVIKGDDSGAPLELTTKEIAAKFVELYWRQCKPFQGVVLQQNTDRQAEVIGHILKVQPHYGESLFRLKQFDLREWSRLVSKVGGVVQKMPLWRLQKVGKERLEFLYDNLDFGKTITLKAGVAYCLRAFHELLLDLIRGAWVRWVQKYNANALNNVTDLASFLFGQERTNLDAYRSILMEVQRGKCLYCGNALLRNSQVDHFIPWSRYPADMGYNFVLAHAVCNRAKSDYLAAEAHLAAWSERNRLHYDELLVRLQEAALPFDLSASVQVAQWAYEQTEKANGQVWVANGKLQHLSPAWRACFAA
jgi:5-methylcytosine-specific restriction endonuclease McrA